MQFECYDVLEIQGTRYVITEKITYWESNEGSSNKKDSSSSNPYRKNSKSEYWHEYGVSPIGSKDKWWLTITDDKHYATFSQNSYIRGIPTGYTLREEGVQEVTAVDGSSDAHIADIADYKCYERYEGEKTLVFFMEKWREGITTYASGERIPLGAVRICKDPDALKAGNKVKRKRHIQIWSYIIFGFMFMAFVLGNIITDGEPLTWRNFREGMNFPYTMEEQIGDSKSYVEEPSKGPIKVYTTNKDPISVAVEFIDAVNGKLVRDIENLSSGNERIVLYTRNEICLIYTKDNKTYVELVNPRKITTEMQQDIDAIHRVDNLLERYANLIKEKDNSGRNTLFKDMITW